MASHVIPHYSRDIFATTVNFFEWENETFFSSKATIPVLTCLFLRLQSLVLFYPRKTVSPRFRAGHVVLRKFDVYLFKERGVDLKSGAMLAKTVNISDWGLHPTLSVLKYRIPFL